MLIADSAELSFCRALCLIDFTGGEKSYVEEGGSLFLFVLL